MNVFDIALALLAVWAVYRGFTRGAIVQLGSLAGILAGAWAAFRFGTPAGEFFGLEGAAAAVTGFVAIFVAAVVAVAVASRLLRGLSKLTGLGPLDRLAGVLFSLLKTALFAGVLLYAFDGSIRSDEKLAAKADESKLYGAVTALPGRMFPYADICRAWVAEKIPSGHTADDEEDI